MTSIDSLNKRVDALQTKLEPPVAREMRLPFLVIDPATGADWPGYEQHNREHERLARRLNCNPQLYGFDPAIEGTEP